MLADSGGRPFCLSRGYGGTEAGPKLVDNRADSAAQVGDEALLLARAAPTVVARDRVGGAELAQAQGANVIILDDGLQNPSLAKDFTLAVIDARRGSAMPACSRPALYARRWMRNSHERMRCSSWAKVTPQMMSPNVCVRGRVQSFMRASCRTGPWFPPSAGNTSWLSQALATRTSFLQPW